MKRVKVYDQYEFPMNLNLEPYTKEGLARKEAQALLESDPQRAQQILSSLPSFQSGYYNYELSGILVHTGTAESGHYYSFIRVSLFLCFQQTSLNCNLGARPCSPWPREK